MMQSLPSSLLPCRLVNLIRQKDQSKNEYYERGKQKRKSVFLRNLATSAHYIHLHRERLVINPLIFGKVPVSPYWNKASASSDGSGWSYVGVGADNDWKGSSDACDFPPQNKPFRPAQGAEKWFFLSCDWGKQGRTFPQRQDGYQQKTWAELSWCHWRICWPRCHEPSRWCASRFQP